MYEIARNLGEAEPSENEDRIIDDIIEDNVTMMEKSDGLWKRAQHPKAHGLVKATLEILELAEKDSDLKHGLFATNARHDAIVRFSNAADSVDNDEKGDAHGMAIKILGIGGKKFIADPAHPDSFDIILLDNETFFEGDLKQFSIFNDLTAEIANSRRNKEDLVVGVLNGLWLKFFRKFFGKDLLTPALETSDQKPVSPLRSIYWSTVPYLLGKDVAVKYLARPVPEPTPQELTGGVTDPDGLSTELRRGLAGEERVFDFFVEVQSDPNSHPVEDPSIPWANARTVQVARIVIHKLGEVTDEHWADNLAQAEVTAFNPWNVTQEHRPLGAINRARGKVYERVRRRRENRN